MDVNCVSIYELQNMHAGGRLACRKKTSTQNQWVACRLHQEKLFFWIFRFAAHSFGKQLSPEKRVTGLGMGWSV